MQSDSGCRPLFSLGSDASSSSWYTAREDMADPTERTLESQKEPRAAGAEARTAEAPTATAAAGRSATLEVSKPPRWYERTASSRSADVSSPVLPEAAAARDARRPAHAVGSAIPSATTRSPVGITKGVVVGKRSSSPQPQVSNPSLLKYGRLSVLIHFTPVGSSPFDDVLVHRRFITKVYVLLGFQSMIVSAFAAVCLYSKDTRQFIQQNLAFYVFAYVVCAVIYITHHLLRDKLRRRPADAIYFFLFTLTLSYIFGAAAGFHDSAAFLVIPSTLVCTAVSVSITVSVTSRMYTLCHGAMLCLSSAVACCSIAFVLTYLFDDHSTRTSNLVQIPCGTVVALVLTLLMVCSAPGKIYNQDNTISEADYSYFTVSLYTDIMDMLLAPHWMCQGFSRTCSRQCISHAQVATAPLLTTAWKS